MDTVKVGRYWHYKSQEFTVIGVAVHSETREELVVYREEFGDHGLRVESLAHGVSGVIPVGIKVEERVAARKDEIGEGELVEKRAANCQQSKIGSNAGQRWSRPVNGAR